MSNEPPTSPFVPGAAQTVDADTITQSDLAGLKEHIDRVQADAEVARQTNLVCWRRLLFNRVCLFYLLSARFVRNRALALLGYRWAVVALGTTLTWAVFAIVTSSFLFGLVGAPIGVVLFTCLLYLPTNEKLPAALKGCAETDAALVLQLRSIGEKVAQAKSDVAASQERYKQWELWLQQTQLRVSIERRRQELAASDWKSLRRNDFKQFLSEGLRLRYYDVVETGQAGDHGVDLIATRDGKRIAILAKGYARSKSVDEKAVQEALYGKNIWRCDACAIITNSNCTTQAKDDAARLGCVMIDEVTLTSLIAGERDLWQECLAAKPIGER